MVETECRSCWSWLSPEVKSDILGEPRSPRGSHWCHCHHHWGGEGSPPLRSKLSSETRSSRGPWWPLDEGGQREGGWEERSEGNLFPALSQP